MISHNHKCIFVHIPKCGGQSIENIFLEANGLNWESRAPLLLRQNDNPLIGPPRLAHLTYRDYLDYCYVSPDLMQTYTTFTIVRNPYKRIESLYHYLGYDCAVPFSRFVTQVLAGQLEKKGDLYWFVRPQHEYVCDHAGTIAVDKVIKLEQLDEDIHSLLASVGIESKSIPHVNKSKKKSVLTYFRKRISHSAKGCFSLSPFVSAKPVWSTTALAAVNHFYMIDFQSFGYNTKVCENA